MNCYSVGISNGDIVGELRTVDGFVYLRKSIPETFDIALKMLECLQKRLDKKEILKE